MVEVLDRPGRTGRLHMFGEPVIPFGDVEHEALRHGVVEFLSDHPRLLGALAPVFGIFEEPGHRESL
jgi:hypothetical protein